MKQLTKEQLTDLVKDNYKRITELNIDGIGERVADFIKDSKDNWEEIMKFVVAYCAEIRKECCNILIDTLYDVLYNE